MIPEPLARWIRGEADNVEFERWLYANTDLLERVLGKDRALELIELDWRRTPTSPYALEQMRMKLVADARKTCVCPLLRDRHALPLTVETRFTPDSPFTSKFLHLLPLGPHGSQVWRCKACKQAWLVNVDQDDDIWYLQRLTDAQAEDAVERDRWPNTFDDFDLKWPSGHSRWRTTDAAKTFGGTFDVHELFPEHEQH